MTLFEIYYQNCLFCFQNTVSDKKDKEKGTVEPSYMRLFLAIYGNKENKKGESAYYLIQSSYFFEVPIYSGGVAFFRVGLPPPGYSPARILFAFDPLEC